MNDLQIAQSTLARWRESPPTFVREAFGITPDAWQDDVLAAFAKHQRLAMKSCKGPGKSAVLAWLVWNFLATYAFPKVACTSISGDNLRDGLWTELAHWQGKSPWLSAMFTHNSERITNNDHPKDWWAAARTWSQSANAEQQANTLAGLHAENLLFALDEAGGIPDGVFSAAEAGLGTIGGTKRLLMAGNPTTLGGQLYRATTTERHLWHLTEITADPDDPKRTPRVSVEWAREQIEKWGRDNPWVLVNVFGRFPPSSLNSLLGPDDVAAAFSRKLVERDIAHASKLVGVDVARYGDDRTVIFPRQGRAAFAPKILRGKSTLEVADAVIYAANHFNESDDRADAVFIDATGGHGAGVIDICREAGLRVIEVNFSESATEEKFFNKRSQIWWEMCHWVKSASLYNVPEMVRELTEPQFIYVKDQFRMEEKDQIKKRLGFSPDLGDALATTFSVPILPASLDPRRSLPDLTQRRPYDPLAAVRQGKRFDPLGRVQ